MTLIKKAQIIYKSIMIWQAGAIHPHHVCYMYVICMLYIRYVIAYILINELDMLSPLLQEKFKAAMSKTLNNYV